MKVRKELDYDFFYFAFFCDSSARFAWNFKNFLFAKSI